MADMSNICRFINGKHVYWQVRITLKTVRHNKIFPYTDDGLASAIQYRDELKAKLDKQKGFTWE